MLNVSSEHSFKQFTNVDVHHARTSTQTFFEKTFLEIPILPIFTNILQTGTCANTAKVLV